MYPLASSALVSLHLTICVEEDAPTFESTINTLVCVLSSIQSTRLKTVELQVVLNFEEFPQREEVPVTSPANMASLLAGRSRSTFSGDGPNFGIELFLNGDDDTANPVLDAALDILTQFFAPWNERGMLEVIMPRLYRPRAERDADLWPSGPSVSDESSVGEEGSTDVHSSLPRTASLWQM